MGFCVKADVAAGSMVIIGFAFFLDHQQGHFQGALKSIFGAG
jgi:hypothetical protein